MGRGSSREHAALVPLYLGVKAVLVKSFARIHCANLANAGILPLVFENEADYDRIDQMDELELPNVRKEIEAGSSVTVVNKTKGFTIPAQAVLSSRQRDMVLAGGLLNYTREKRLQSLKHSNTRIMDREVCAMDKIQMKTPLVEMDGDEMTRVIWKMLKEILIIPYVDLKTEYYDLGLKHRDETGDRVTVESAEATKKYGVAVKCATITPNAARVKEYDLHEMWKSPNGTIRAILDGTVFRAPILIKGIVPFLPGWKKPITIARHAYGDVYRNTEAVVPAGSKAELVITAPDGTETRELIHDFKGAGVVQGQHNLDDSIASFARACFNYALDTKQEIWFATKDTISKKYDHRFKDLFQEIFDTEYKEKFDAAGIEYFYTLIDDAVARVVRSEGGFIWACKNYDGDVMSDMVATAFGKPSA